MDSNHFRLVVFFLCIGGFSLNRLHSQQLIPFQTAIGKWGYKDSASNKIKIYWHFDEAYHFSSNGLARVKTAGKYSFINSDGVQIIPPLNNCYADFHGDTAYLCESQNTFIIFKQNRYRIRNGGFISIWQHISNKIRFVTFKYPQDSALVARLFLDINPVNEYEKNVKKNEALNKQHLKLRFVPSAMGSAVRNEDSTHCNSSSFEINAQIKLAERLNLIVGFGKVYQTLESTHYRYSNRMNIINFGFMASTKRETYKSTFGFVKCNVSPVFNGIWNANRNNTPKAVNKTSGSPSLITTVGLGLSLGNRIDLAIEYRHIPFNLIYPASPENFFCLSLGFNLNSL